MEDEKVAMVDGVFEGAFGTLGDKTWFENGSSSGCHGGFWWLIMDEEDDETDNELTKKEVKQMEVNDQEIHTILMGLPEDIYDAVDSYATAKEIQLRVEQMLKGSSIGVQEKKAKNKHFSEIIANNLKFLNNLQPEWQRSVTIVHQTKDLHLVDYIQLYDFLKFNQAEVDAIKAERLARTYDPLAIMTNSQSPYSYLVFHQDEPSALTCMQQSEPNNNYIPQPSFNTNYMPQPMPNPKAILGPHNYNKHETCTNGHGIQIQLLYTNQQQPKNFIKPTQQADYISWYEMGQDRQIQMVRGDGGNQFRQYVGQIAGIRM
nr:hypothetical protein [Tanacetum cinerariifolium]